MDFDGNKIVNTQDSWQKTCNSNCKRMGKSWGMFVCGMGWVDKIGPKSGISDMTYPGKTVGEQGKVNTMVVLLANHRGPADTTRAVPLKVFHGSLYFGGSAICNSLVSLIPFWNIETYQIFHKMANISWTSTQAIISQISPLCFT